ncbi:hypothetical protein SSAG_01526 [Streptomyces sp. Mg1]|nr:hypothetical protein SSAG_01526 [Streptomyces sp. Mg1]
MADPNAAHHRESVRRSPQAGRMSHSTSSSLSHHLPHPFMH